MAQNIYDDRGFFDRYSRLDRQVRGLDGAPEWSSIQSMLPELGRARVLDLGCGFGWFARWAVAGGAISVLGLDLSELMLERARADTASELIEYRRADLDDVDGLMVGQTSIDLAFSSLTFHYVRDLPGLLAKIAASLTVGGRLVFSVEHPIFSAPSQQRFEDLPDGRRVWPLEDYLAEGQRITSWFADGVMKEHRTVGTYVNTVVAAGLVIESIQEWGPSGDQIAANPAWAEDLHRPWFLLIAAHKA